MAALQETPTLDEQCLTAFQRLWRGKGDPVVVFALAEETNIIGVVDASPAPTSVAALAESLPSQDIRWFALRASYHTHAGAVRVKVIWGLWVPDSLERSTLKESARVKATGLLGQGVLLQALDFHGVRIEVNNRDELNGECVLERASKGERDEIVEGSFELA